MNKRIKNFLKLLSVSLIFAIISAIFHGVEVSVFYSIAAADE